MEVGWIQRRWFRMLLVWMASGWAGRAVGQTPPPRPATAQTASHTATAASAAQRPKRVITDLSAFHLDRVHAAANQVGAASRGAVTNLVLCAPALGLSSTTRPLFEWRAPDGSADRLTFVLLNDAGDVLVERDATGSSLEYPQDAPALEAGQTYAWKVSGGGLDQLPEAARFEIQAAAPGQGTTGGEGADPLVRAQAMLRKGLWYDAVAALRAGLREHPERSDLVEQLEAMYRAVARACAGAR